MNKIGENYQEKFALAMDRLNTEQREAVETLEGPVLVSAGPGTGKTQVLTLRIANLINQGLAEPQSILALTFTKAAAANMQKRLASMIGPMAYQVTINTFHGFCQEIIEAYGEFFPFRHEAMVLDELTRNEMMEKILLNLPLTTLRPAGDNCFYLRTLVSKIDTLKQEGVTVEKYQELVVRAREETQALIAAEEEKKRPSHGKILQWQRNLAKQEELALVYQSYQQTLRTSNYYDYADMVLETIRAWRENPDLLAKCQETYQYVLVDEYQDTNNAQSEILHLLMAYWQEMANIFVVGDAQQSIYRFQGANLENFWRFEKDYPQAKRITLRVGYRCSEKIYALAQHLMVKGEKLGEEKVEPALKNYSGRTGEPVSLTEYESADSEILDLLQKIKELREMGVPLEKIAVIYRNNNEAARLMELLTANAIPVEIEGGVDVLEQEITEAILLIGKLLVNLDDQEKTNFYLGEIVWQPWWTIDKTQMMALCQRARSERRPLWQLLVSEQERIPGLNKLVQAIENWREKSLTVTARELWKAILTESGLLTWVENQPDKIQNLIYLYTMEKSLAFWEKQGSENFTWRQFIEKMRLMKERGLKMTTLDLDVRAGAVSLTTAHKAKGREWDEVFIYGLNKNNWNKGEREKLRLPAGILREQTTGAEANDEEARRLLFVALTRAKNHLRISWHNLENESLSVAPRLPSPFIYDLRETVETGLTVEGKANLDNEAATKALAIILRQPSKQWAEEEEKVRAYLKEKVATLVLSPSMLNTYLTDTEVFLKQYVLNLPSEPATVALDFGTSIHAALENWYKPRVTGGDFLPVSEVVEIFRRELEAKNLPELAFQDYLKIGQESLAHYSETYLQTDANYQTLAVEKQFGYQNKLMSGQVPVRGKMDRIDLLPDGDNLVRVLDYKSGAAKSENELLGKTASAKLSEREKTLPESLRNSTKRQLLFYKLLCQLEKDFPYQVEYGVIDFVKKTEGNKPVRREFALPDEEVQELQALLEQVWQEILELKFLDV